MFILYDPMTFRVATNGSEWCIGSLLPRDTQIFLRALRLAAPVSDSELYLIDCQKRIVEIRRVAEPRVPWRIAELTAWVRDGHLV